ncbi:MAG: hypothetical protein AAB870_02640 [Patescibacteria group bacterium]
MEGLSNGFVYTDPIQIKVFDFQGFYISSEEIEIFESIVDLLTEDYIIEEKTVPETCSGKIINVLLKLFKKETVLKRTKSETKRLKRVGLTHARPKMS